MASAWETPGSAGVAMAVFEAANKLAAANRLRVRFPLKMGIGMFVMLSHLSGLLQRTDEERVQRLRGTTTCSKLGPPGLNLIGETQPLVGGIHRPHLGRLPGWRFRPNRLAAFRAHRN